MPRQAMERWLENKGDSFSLILMALAVLRIVATYTVLSATSDEAVHLTSGLELLARGQFTILRENPPVPKLILAAPLHLAGVQFDSGTDDLTQIRRLFHSNGNYRTNLFLGRAGNLFFFLVACLATWWWTRQELGRAGGLLATLFLTTQPVVLGYSGIANHDAAALAGVAVSLLVFARWMAQPTPVRAIVFGAACGMAIGWKLSCLVYVPAACLAMYAVRSILDEQTRRTWRKAVLALPLAAATAFLVLWASYGFAFGSLEESGGRLPWLGDHWISSVFARIDPKQPIPFPQFFHGLAGVIAFERGGLVSYLLGEARVDGFRHYFPVAVAVKTTLASLLFILCGLFFSQRRVFFPSLAAALAILAAAMPSTLNLGVRYVLPLYAPLTVAMAAAAVPVLRSERKWLRLAGAALLSWHLAVSALAHPDYFPYFNELAGRHPSRVLVDSNLDWGQDLLRLKREVERLQIPLLKTSLVGSAELDALGFPPHQDIDAWTPVHGLVAVSDHMYRVLRAQGGFRWLVGRPYRRVGTSIRLYEVQ